MQLFRFILASLLALVLVLIPTLSYANSATAKLPAGFQMPAVGDVAKRVVSRSNAVSYAVKGLLGAVTWVLDTKNNRVTFHGKPIGVFSVRDGSIGSISSLQDHACTKAYYGEGRNYKETHLDNWFAGSLYIKCNNGWAILEPLKENGSVSYEQIATEIIKNAQAGHAESVEFVKSVAADIAKQDEAEPKPAPKPIASTNANEDTDTSNPDKEKDDKPEPPKTCSNQFPEYKTCSSLHKFGFTYATKKSALERSGIIGSRLSKQTSWNTFCGKHGTHDNYRPTPKTESSRHSNFAGTISSCKCCIDSSSGAKIITIFKAN